MLLEAIQKRFSVRRFHSKPIEQDKIDEIIKAAQLAPSARNYQPWKFVIIRDSEKRRQLTDVCKGQKFVSEAPITIAICCNNMDYAMTCGQTAAVIDGAIAGEHIALQAVELGLGSCWIGAFHQKPMQELISLPEDFQVIGLLPIGYPDTEKTNRNLKPFEEIVSYDCF